MPGLSPAPQLTLGWGHSLFLALFERRDLLWVTPSRHRVSLCHPPVGALPVQQHCPARVCDSPRGQGDTGQALFTGSTGCRDEGRIQGSSTRSLQSPSC